ncbi:MAG: hypothetical protein JWN89_17 [Parcubacteria group bacterium]|nr:hypothetical protein [Parcubacteria group bacterium]
MPDKEMPQNPYDPASRRNDAEVRMRLRERRDEVQPETEEMRARVAKEEKASSLNVLMNTRSE